MAARRPVDLAVRALAFAGLGLGLLVVLAFSASAGDALDTAEPELVLERSFTQEHAWGLHPGFEADTLGIRYYWYEVDVPADAAEVVVTARLVDQPADTANLQLEAFDAERSNAGADTEVGVDRDPRQVRVSWEDAAETASWNVATDEGAAVERTFETRIRAYAPSEGTPMDAAPGTDAAGVPGSPPSSAGASRGGMLVSVLGGLATVAVSRGAMHGLGLRGYSRIQDDEVLDHPVRARVYEAVQAQPGAMLEDLAGGLEVSRSAVEHHLRKLASAGLVTLERRRRRVHAFETGTVEPEQREALALLATDTARRALGVVAERPRGVRELGRALGVSASTASYHVANLQEAGLVEARREGPLKRLEPTSAGRRALERFGRGR